MTREPLIRIREENNRMQIRRPVTADPETLERRDIR
jgi:putative ubiquitin-RnfH superfamily antitoxin RatB of RatAB toxin-antitoxin module